MEAMVAGDRAAPVTVIPLHSGTAALRSFGRDNTELYPVWAVSECQGKS